MNFTQKMFLAILFLSLNVAHCCTAHKKFNLLRVFSPIINFLKPKTSSKSEDNRSSIVKCKTNDLNNSQIDLNPQTSTNYSSTSAKTSIDSNLEENKEFNKFIHSLEAEDINSDKINISDPDFLTKIPNNLLPKK